MGTCRRCWACVDDWVWNGSSIASPAGNGVSLWHSSSVGSFGRHPSWLRLGALSPETADSSLGRLLGLEEIKGNELLAVLDWLRARQRWIERGLARRHPGTDTLILYDVSSSYLEGRCCPLAAFGHDRDGKRGKRRILFGLLCAPDGCPVAVEVFPGNRSDPSTVATQVEKTRRRFGIRRLVLVGDRGMITSTRIREDLKPADLDWISALRYSSIRKLAQTGSGDQAPFWTRVS